MRDETDDKENIIVIYFDPNNKIDDCKERFNEINVDIIFHTEFESCLTYIESINKQKVFLIIPPSQILSQFINLQQIHSIFMFCFNHNQYDYSFIENPKVIGIYDTIDALNSSIQEEIRFIVKQTSTWCCFDQNEFADKDLSKHTSNFLWLQLFHNVLLHLSHNEHAKNQMIDACYEYYQSNPEEVSLIDEFKQKYQSKEALRWFIKNPFLQKMINKALQTENTIMLYALRYFLIDLLKNLTDEHQQIIQSNREKLIVYRVMKLSNAELKQLQDNQGQLMSMKGFFMAHTDRSSILTLPISSSIEPSNLISVLFEIECNVAELGDNLIFADISQFIELSSFQETILFDFNATFRLETVRQDKQIWIIKLIAVNDGRSILQKYIDDTHRQIEGLSIPIIFGEFLYDMDEWNQSQEYFEKLINDSAEEDVAWIEHRIGQAHRRKGELGEARQHYDRAYDLMMKSEPVRIKDSAIVLSDISKILYDERKYDEAYDFNERALTIYKQYYSSNHPHIAHYLERSAVIHFKRSAYDEALTLCREALSIQEEYYNHFHIDIARNLNFIGCILKFQGNYNEALSYRQRAVLMYEKYYPSGDELTAWSWNGISDILRHNKKYNEALCAAQRALIIQKKCNPHDHIRMTDSLSRLGHIKVELLNYDESLALYHQTLAIQQRCYSAAHPDICNTLMNIGYVQLYEKKNYNEALDCYQQALQMLETSDPSNHNCIALALHQIGCVLCQQRKFDDAFVYYQRALVILEEYCPMDFVTILACTESLANISYFNSLDSQAIEYLEKCLRISEATSPQEHSTIVSILKRFAPIHRICRQYQLSLTYEMKCLSIQEKFLHPNHQEIGKVLSNIGTCYQNLNHLKLALEYFKQALAIYEQCLPIGHEDLEGVIIKIQNLSKQIII